MSEFEGRRAIHCILPPHVVRHVAEHGSTDQRTKALRTLSIDQTLRAARAAMPRPTPAAVPAGVGKHRTICTANGAQTLPGQVSRVEGQPPVGDAASDEAYDGLGATWDFYWEALGRASIDDEGMPLVATVHFGQAYDNAFWNGQQMVFGDGDGDLFNRFTLSLDVIGHELSHGVVEDEAQLQYFQQAGALNESIADVFGSLVKQWRKNQTAAAADWLIGEGLFTATVNGRALRSMKEPGTAYDDAVLGKDPQPDHWGKFVHTFEDNGGVHINSGIPNKAFCVAAIGMGGYAWEKAGRVWYETLRDSRLRPNTGFRRFARLTIANAERLYGTGSDEVNCVAQGWSEVGIE